MRRSTPVLPRMGLRYFAVAPPTASESEFSAIVVHRSPEQGHIGKPGLAMLDCLVRTCVGHSTRRRGLKGTESRTNAFERALDRLTDGAALLRKDGRVLYSNAAFDVIVRNNDGVWIAKGESSLPRRKRAPALPPRSPRPAASAAVIPTAQTFRFSRTARQGCAGLHRVAASAA